MNFEPKITKAEIDERMQEIVEARLSDDEYLIDALLSCLTEVRNVINATSLDDILDARDELKNVLEAYYKTEQLRAEVEAQLEIEAIPNDADRYEANRHD